MGFSAVERDMLFEMERRDLEPDTLVAQETDVPVAIVGFAPDIALSARYAELGFTVGTTVTVLRRALFGDPIEVLVRGTRYALRKADAAGILVKKLR